MGASTRRFRPADMMLAIAASAAVASCGNLSGAAAGAAGGSVGPGAPTVEQSTTDGANSTSAIAAAVASGAESQASGQDVGLHRGLRPLLELFFEMLNPIASAVASNACPLYEAGGGTTCAGSGLEQDQVATLAYSGCSFGSSTAVWNGGQVLTFGGSAVCGTTTLPIVNSGDQLTRAFTGSVSTVPTTRTSSTGVSVQLDTGTAYGYSVGVSGGMFIAGATASGSSSTTHTIEVLGLHAVSSLWDYSISNSTVLTVENPGTSSTVIESGALTVQHNTDRFTGTAVFTEVAYNGSSCFPQSGSITTTFSGSITGQETLTFTGGGGARFVNVNGVASDVNLTHCF